MYIDGDGARRGFLCRPNELDGGDVEGSTGRGTLIVFAPESNEDLRCWFGHESPEIYNNLAIFAITGGDGSMAAIWKDPSGRQRIVHLGSGSGSTLCCVLAETPVDFLRLIAIGYDEICWPEYFDLPPDAPGVRRNLTYQRWVCETFHTTIPKTASEIVRYPDSMDDRDPSDDFAKWCCSIEP